MTFTCSRRGPRLSVFGLTILLAASPLVAQTYTVRTYAGPSEPRGGATDGNRMDARFRGPAALAFDAEGNLFVADARNYTVRRAGIDGFLTTLAGLAGEPGNVDGRGFAARFEDLSGLAVDAHGNVYVADATAHTVRRIRADGSVETIAGLAGTAGTSDGERAGARFQEPRGLAVDAEGNVFVADSANHVIRRITPGGRVTTIAGLADTSGFSDGEGAGARFSFPLALAVDGRGDLYVSEAGGVRRVTPAGTVTTVFRSSTTVRDDHGHPAAFVAPRGIVVDDRGAIFLSDARTHVVRRIDPDGSVITLAGSFGIQFPEYRDGIGTRAMFNRPTGIALDSHGNLYVADEGHNVVRRIAPDALVTTVFGAFSGGGGVDGPGPAARFASPAGMAFDREGNLYLADIGDRTIRKISPDRVVSTVAGQLRSRGIEDGPLAEARFMTPTDVAIDRIGNIIVADAGAHTIRRISPSAVRTIAGVPDRSGTADGKATEALFNAPRGVAVDSAGNIVVADSLNHTIRRLSPGSMVSTFSGEPGMPAPWDGHRTNAMYRQPEAVAFDPAGNLYIADARNYTIRKLSNSGLVTTFAGRATVGGRADGVGAGARFWYPSAVAADSRGYVYVGDDDRVRMIDPSGQVKTIAVLETVEDEHDSRIYGGMATGIAVDASENVYVSDGGGGAVLILSPTLRDMATIDDETGAVGAMRQLSPSIGEADTWEWTITRRPTGSVAELSDPHAKNPTFTPDVADRYEFRLVASNHRGASVTAVSLTATERSGRTRAVSH